jgi:hypothetical protein
MLGTFKTEHAEIPAAVQVANFTIGAVDTQYSEADKEVFRRTMAVIVPNVLQETLGKRQVFSQVARVETAGGHADYVIVGNYDFFERLGTQGREWIPYAGLFGAKINEATVRGTMRVVVQDARTGASIMDRTFTEQHSERTSVYTRPLVGYLQADHMAEISEAIISAIRASPSVRRGGDMMRPQGATTAVATDEELVQRLRNLEGLRRDGLISDREYRDRRRQMIESAL